ncbi:GMP synthase [Paenibacillus sp. GCM10027627]|uniref:glutamine amidotransferase-related protein n=1 Tax=unclassified Paenibacillus TaxID=185978 RepID=UPI00362B0F26
MNVHFVIHEQFEAPGAFQLWAEERGYRTGYSRVYTGEKLPLSQSEIDLLIVMGGPQSPDTTREECAHFDAAAEMELIRSCIRAGKAVVGVCLGAQLIGAALGARQEHSPEIELGCFPISFTQAGSEHPLFAHFGETISTGHWHHDMPGLTKDSKIIAHNEACPRQIVEYGSLVYGFQCHLEFTPQSVQLLLAASAAELEQHRDRRFVQTSAQLKDQNYQTMNNHLFLFLDKLVNQYLNHK